MELFENDGETLGNIIKLEEVSYSIKQLNGKLNAQIQENKKLVEKCEKMKCCGNCKNRTKRIDTGMYLVPCEIYYRVRVCDEWEFDDGQS